MCVDDDDKNGLALYSVRPIIWLHRGLALARGHLQVGGGGVAEHQEVNLEYFIILLLL